MVCFIAVFAKVLGIREANVDLFLQLVRDYSSTLKGKRYVSDNKAKNTFQTF